MASAGSLEENNFKIPSVFGSKAAYKTAPNDFPTNSPTNSVKASWLNGFPAQTFKTNNAPSGADFNGLFGLLSGLLMNTQMGQMINTYDATYQSKIGGYPNGAIIWFVPNNNWSNRMLFQSTADGNTNVPYNTGTSTVGTGWKQLLPVIPPSPCYSTPTITLISTNTPRGDGNINLSQTIDNFDAVMVIFSGDEHYTTDAHIFTLWQARFCYDNYPDSAFVIAGGGGDLTWAIRMSTLFTTTWSAWYENCIIRNVYGLKW